MKSLKIARFFFVVVLKPLSDDDDDDAAVVCIRSVFMEMMFKANNGWIMIWQKLASDTNVEYKNG